MRGRGYNPTSCCTRKLISLISELRESFAVLARKYVNSWLAGNEANDVVKFVRLAGMLAAGRIEATPETFGVYEFRRPLTGIDYKLAIELRQPCWLIAARLVPNHR